MAVLKEMKELVVGYHENFNLDIDKAPLAFLTYDTHDAASKKRIDTVKNWYGSEKMCNLDNPPLSGFTFVDVVSRYRTKNKLMRVFDPRGFIVEVSIDILLEIMQSATIKNGVIQEKCFWARKGAENILIPENTPLHEQYLSETVYAKAANISTKNLKVGGLYINKDGKKYFYLGKLVLKVDEENTSSTAFTKYSDLVKNKYEFYVFANLSINAENVDTNYLVVQHPTMKEEDTTQFKNEIYSQIEKTYNAYEIAEQINLRNMWLAWREEQVPYRLIFNCYDAKVFYKYELVVN